MRPSLSVDEIKQLALKGNVIPLYATMQADMITPVSAYLKYCKNQPHSFLFESVLAGEHISRYSFLGCNPRKVITVQGRDPLVELEAELKQYNQVAVSDLPEFTGGAVGYIGYDCVQYFESKTSASLEDVLKVPDSIMFLCDSIIIFDHLFSTVKVVSNMFINEETDIEQEYNKAWTKIQEICAVLTSTDVQLPQQPPIDESYDGISNFDQKSFENVVTLLKENIRNGDIIQAVPSRRIAKKTNLHPFNAYRTLRSVNPSPYMFYVNLGDFQLVGASPELLVKVLDQKVHTSPIAGTRPRGKTIAEDKFLANDLLQDLKERSEHVMLVDLGRNDINRICDPMTVKVDSLMHVERYAHVMHIVSNVSGILRPEKTRFDAFRSVFPAGTLSGAPKIRAMQLIYDCEKQKRGPYGGAVGWFGYSNNLDTCIAIRTMVFKDGVAYLQAGAGIVYDSDPTNEYIETCNKLKSNIVTLEKAESLFKA